MGDCEVALASEKLYRHRCSNRGILVGGLLSNGAQSYSVLDILRLDAETIGLKENVTFARCWCTQGSVTVGKVSTEY